MKNPVSASLFIAIILFYGCSKSSSEQPVPPVPPVPPVTPAADHSPDVYAVGTIYRGVSIAAYWKNDSLVELTKSPMVSEAYGIAVVGNDVYVCGYYGDGSYGSSAPGLQACYWENGQMVDLSHGYSFELARAIAVKGQDVYIAGYGLKDLSSNNFRVAEIWKNGVRSQISKDSGWADVDGIFVSGDDVYVAGIQSDLFNYSNALALWKNGMESLITDGTKETRASDIFVSGQDVYISGYEYLPSAGTGTYLAKYWKNGQPVVLSDSAKPTKTNSIMVSGQDVYVTGYEFPGGDSDPTHYKEGRFWKNGVLMDLPGGIKSSQVMHTAMLNGDLYIAASEEVADHGQISAFCFKNNAEKVYTDGVNKSGIIYRILVVPK